MRIPVSLNALQAFEAAARHLSIKDAALELAVTPSAVSHQLRTLEDMLGVEKQLGNIKSSHKSITFTGLVHLAHGRAQYVHYLTDPVFCQQHPAGSQKPS